jgi:hypothetical protein
MNILTKKEFMDILIPNMSHVEKLYSIIREVGGFLQGNCVFKHNAYYVQPSELIPKQINLVSAGVHASDHIVEVGFGAGHSTLFFLLANPTIKVTVFDTCQFSYTKPCYNYIKETFGDRVNLIEGDSKDTFTKWVEERQPTDVTLVHLDECHDISIVSQNLETALAILPNGGHIIRNDTDNPYIKDVCNNEARIVHIHHLETPMYPHSIYIVS